MCKPTLAQANSPRRLKKVNITRINWSLSYPVNQRLDESVSPTIKANTIFVLFVIIMGLEAVVYTLSIASNGLYVVNEAATISFPSSVKDAKNHDIEAMVPGFEITKVKEDNRLLSYAHPSVVMYLEISHKSQEHWRSHRRNKKKQKKRKTIKRLTAKLTELQEENENWTGPVWFPPSYTNNFDTDD